MPYIGKTPSKVPLDSSDIADGTITNDDLAGSITEGKLAGSIPDAKIVGLTASKLSGVVPTANLGTGTASSTTVLYGDGTYKAEPVTDTTSINNDISLLALQTAINGNLSAYGLKNSWIEQFENSTYIENLTNTLRETSDEYINATAFGSPVVTLGPVTGGAFGTGYHNYNFSSLLTSHTGTYQQIRATVTTTGAGDVVNAGIAPRTGSYWDTTVSPSLAEFKWSGSSGASGSSQTSDWLDFTMASGTDYVWRVLSGNHTNSYFNTGGFTGTTSTTSPAGSVGWDATDWPDVSGGTRSYYLMQMEGRTSSINATGSFNSTDVVPQDTTNKSSVGLVILYKDQAGTTTFNGANQLVAKVRANTGQAYQEVVLAGAGTYSDGLKIAIAPAIAVTAGQALSYEISFAGQSGSLETRVHGVAMTY